MKLIALVLIKYLCDKGEKKTALAGDVFTLSETYAADLIDNGWARPAKAGEIADFDQEQHFIETAKKPLPVPPRAKPAKSSVPKVAKTTEKPVGEDGDNDGDGENGENGNEPGKTEKPAKTAKTSTAGKAKRDADNI